MYNWSKPITWAEFIKYPHDIQEECLLHFSEKFCCTNTMFAEMVGKSVSAVATYFNKHSLTKILKYRSSDWAKNEFEAWLSEFRTEAPVEEPKQKPDKKQSVVIPAFKNVFSSGGLEVEGLPSEIGTALFNMFQNTKIHARIDFYVIEDVPEKVEEIIEDELAQDNPT